jgi:hypothetical protein
MPTCGSFERGRQDPPGRNQSSAELSQTAAGQDPKQDNCKQRDRKKDKKNGAIFLLTDNCFAVEPDPDPGNSISEINRI